MHGFAVNRFAGNDFDVRKHHVSLVCPLNLSVIDNFDLPFDKDEDDSVHSGSCGSLLYFIAGPHFAKIVIWNTTSKQFIKVLDPPVSIPGHCDVAAASALGYDAKSRQYKLVRYCMQFPINDNGHVTEFTARDTYFDLYSFKYGTWNKLKKPFADIKFYPHVTGVYITRTGSCYWTAEVDGLPDEPWTCVLSFDFATEIFDRFPLPASLDPGTHYKLVECYGYLGALVYCREDELSPLDVEVFVRRGTEWERMYAVSFDYFVERPLGLKDDRLLFILAEVGGGRSQLMTYDLVTALYAEVNIKDYGGDLRGVSYAATTGISYAATTGMSYAKATGISYAETTDQDSIPVTMISPNKEKEKEKEKEKKKKQEKKKRKKKEKKQQQQQEKEDEKEKEKEKEEQEQEKEEQEKKKQQEKEKEKEKDEKQQQQEEEKKKKKQEEEEEKQSHIPHSWTRTSLVKACNGIEEVEHVALKEISINIY